MPSYIYELITTICLINNILKSLIKILYQSFFFVYKHNIYFFSVYKTINFSEKIFKSEVKNIIKKIYLYLNNLKNKKISKIVHSNFLKFYKNLVN